MATFSVKYMGDLQLECTHDASGAVIRATAPKDNGGTGDCFSASDLCATSLGTCALTIMGLYAKKHGLDIAGAAAKVTKTMGANPRRIACVEVTFTMPAGSYSQEDKAGLEQAANTCPVCYSLHPDIEQKFTFVWL